ncbi:SLAP domain-containing protein, partial [Desulfocurvus sp. DL9XJH121]
MLGRKFYAIGNQSYLLADHFKRSKTKVDVSSKAPIDKQKKRLMHSSYIYNSAGHRRNGFILAPGSRVQISKKINSVVG